MIEITCIECGDKFNKFQGSMEERTCMTCILKAEDPDVIRPAPVNVFGGDTGIDADYRYEHDQINEVIESERRK